MRRRDFFAVAATWALMRPTSAQSVPKRIGILMSTADTDARELRSIEVFLRTLADLGWDKGRNIEFSYGWGAGDAQRMQANARAMVALNPDLLVVKGGALPSAREATSTIPIVFANGKRPSQVWSRREPQPARRQRHRGDLLRQPDGNEAARPVA